MKKARLIFKTSCLISVVAFCLAGGLTLTYAAPQKAEAPTAQENKTDETDAQQEKLKQMVKQAEKLSSYNKLRTPTGIRTQKKLPKIPQIPKEPVMVPRTR